MYLDKELTQSHLLTLIELGFIDLTPRQKDMLHSFVDKYQKKGIPKKIQDELLKDAKLLMLFC